MSVSVLLQQMIIHNHLMGNDIIIVVMYVLDNHFFSRNSILINELQIQIVSCKQQIKSQEQTAQYVTM